MLSFWLGMSFFIGKLGPLRACKYIEEIFGQDKPCFCLLIKHTKHSTGKSVSIRLGITKFFKAADFCII